MTGYVGTLEKVTLDNSYFRKVLFTGKNSQLVVMCLKAGEEIGNEIHPNVDQFFRLEEGDARFIFNGKEEHLVHAGDAVVVPAGTYHNVINTSSKNPLKLYTIYTPPQHPDGTVHKTKAEAEAVEEHEHLKTPDPNIRQAVPFFGVTNMEASLRFYLDGLGFVMTKHWTVEGKVRWCWLEMGAAAIMLQGFFKEGVGPWLPEDKLGVGVTISFQCEDALAIYHAATAKGIKASRPFVGNNMWVTTVFDPDGYRLEFESPTDVPEGTEYEE